MARFTGWESIPMTEGGKEPAWPLPSVTPKFATWSFAGGRPFGCADGKCERWHAGIDLTDAPNGAVVIAPEDGGLVGLDKGWTDGTRAIFLRTDSGLFLVLGGLLAGSHKEFGHITAARVRRGDKLGRIVGSYGMLHLETYVADAHRVANSRWWREDPAPEGLRNPTNYVERMVGAKASLLQTRQRLQALKELGHYAGDVGAAWGAPAIEALKKAQTALGVEVDGKWGPETEDAIQTALQGSDMAESDDARPTSDTPAPMRIAGGVVAGLAIAGLTAAIATTLRRRRAHEEHDGV